MLPKDALTPMQPSVLQKPVCSQDLENLAAWEEVAVRMTWALAVGSSLAKSTASSEFSVEDSWDLREALTHKYLFAAPGDGSKKLTRAAM